jgi:ADP-ribose pyrophosphatase
MHETLLKAQKFVVERRRYTTPNGTALDREIIVHPGAVIVLPLLTDSDIVMIHNYRYAIERELLELPAGTLDPDEGPATCAARELEEETGYRARRIEPMGEFYTTPGIANELMRCFVAYDLQQTQQRLDSGERIRTEVVPMSRAITMISDGTIVDAKTIALLLRYHLGHPHGRAG